MFIPKTQAERISDTVELQHHILKSMKNLPTSKHKSETTESMSILHSLDNMFGKTLLQDRMGVGNTP